MIALSTDQFDELMSRTGTAREAPAAKIFETTPQKAPPSRAILMPKSKTFRLNHLSDVSIRKSGPIRIGCHIFTTYSLARYETGAVKIAVGSRIPLESFPGCIREPAGDKSF